MAGPTRKLLPRPRRALVFGVNWWVEHPLLWGPIAIAVGYVVVNKPIVAVLLAGVTACLLCPLWMLLAGAVVGQHLIPIRPVIGVLLLSDFVLIAFVLRWATSRLGRNGQEQSGHRLLITWLLAFVAWAWLTLWVTGSWGTSTGLIRVSLYALVFVATTERAGLATPLLRFIAVYAVGEAILAMVGVTPQVEERRLVGFYGDPGVMGALVIAGIAGSTALPARFRVVVLAVLVPAAILTFTRATWAAVMVQMALIVLPMVRRRRRFIVLATGLTLLVALWTAPYLTERFELNPESLPLRLSSWGFAADLIDDNLVFGLGWNVGGMFGVGQNPYNLWLNVAASTGVLGAILLTGFLATAVGTLVRSASREAQAGLIYMAGFLILSVQSMTIRAAGTVTLAFVCIVGTCLAEAGRRLPARSAAEEEKVAACGVLQPTVAARPW